MIRNSIILILVLGIIFSQWFCTYPLAAKPIRLIVNSKDITSLASPILESGRILVPVRFVTEELGARVGWNNAEKKVTIRQENLEIVLRIDSHLVSYNTTEGQAYNLLDVAPKIIHNLTYVPLRFISNALAIGIEWDEDARTVYVDSSKTSDIEPFYPIELSSINSGQVIEGKTNLQVEIPEENLRDASEIKYILLEANTSEGFVIARGNDLTGSYSWLPDIKDSGHKVLVAALYDKNGRFIGGDAKPIYLGLKPRVSLEGIVEGDVYTDPISLGTDVNFKALFVRYELRNLETGRVQTFGEDAPIDPYGQYKWTPATHESGSYSIKAIAYDMNEKPYESEAVNIKVEISPKLSLAGIGAGQTIDKPVNLLASRNFNVSETQYLMREPTTGKETILATIPYGNYKWFPGPEITGEREVFVQVKDTRGLVHESKGIKVNLPGKPLLLLEGVGPNQVLREDVKLKVTSNVKLDKVTYSLIHKDTGKVKSLGKDLDPLEEFLFSPKAEDAGYWNLKATGIYKGKEIDSEEIPIRIYFGDTYKSVPVIEKDKFLGLASNLAKKSYRETNMSAALQTAQSILETGWGQSLPVDKYSGKLSYNLFGIKGQGPKGSVVYNTWEVYNGRTYHVDAEFRAYNSVEESWADHKSFLLGSARYEPVRQVMHDSLQGAWALKRAGYATDPEYAIKLIRIINQYNLEELDKVKI